MLTIKSRSHDYTVEEFVDLTSALRAVSQPEGACYLIDQIFSDHHREAIASAIPRERAIFVKATEEQKSFAALTPLFIELMERHTKRDSVLTVIGGGVMQDIGCFVASVLFRGIRWEIIPTTLLAQADSCIGSKSSINIGPYKNQIGTFFPPHRVLLTSAVLATLPWDEIRSGVGEMIKLHLLAGELEYNQLIADLDQLPGNLQILDRWVPNSLRIKKTYIEQDEYDRGVRNLLNYGHTFGHAYESATGYEIPHGIAVTLGVLTATWISAKKDWVPMDYFRALKNQLRPWYEPFDLCLRRAEFAAVVSALQRDKKNVGDTITCILTRGPGRMEKSRLDLNGQLQPQLLEFLAKECQPLHSSG